MTKFKLMDWLIFGVIVSLIIYSIYKSSTLIIPLLYGVCFLNLLLVINLYRSNPFIKHQNLKSIIAAIYLMAPFAIAYFDSLHSEFYFLFIGSIILIWVSDTAAYFVGSQIGKRKLFPSISPKKTWEGFYGAGMCVFIFAYVVFSISEYKTLSFWMLFALIVWLGGAVGDLIASHVKRLHQVKDSGSLLPGHGGFYDRFDAFIFILPFVLLLNHMVT